MARRASDTAQLKLRIREDLRRRLEQAAKKRGVSLNFEMTSRLTDSFALRKIDEVASNLESGFGRFARVMENKILQEELMQAAEALIERLPADIQEREAVKAAVEQVQKTIKLIAAKVGRIPAYEPWENDQ